MHSEADQLRTLGLMAAHESEVADLYRALAKTFPQYSELFQELAGQEVEHAKNIAGFAELVKEGAAQVNPGRFSSESILASIGYVRQQTKRAREGGASLRETLATCADLESSFIEKRYFDVLEGDSSELRTLLLSLDRETREHREKLWEAWQTELSKAP